MLFNCDRCDGRYEEEKKVRFFVVRCKGKKGGRRNGTHSHQYHRRNGFFQIVFNIGWNLEIYQTSFLRHFREECHQVLDFIVIPVEYIYSGETKGIDSRTCCGTTTTYHKACVLFRITIWRHIKNVESWELSYKCITNAQDVALLKCKVRLWVESWSLKTSPSVFCPTSLSPLTVGTLI